MPIQEGVTVCPSRGCDCVPTQSGVAVCSPRGYGFVPTQGVSTWLCELAISKFCVASSPLSWGWVPFSDVWQCGL